MLSGAIQVHVQGQSVQGSWGHGGPDPPPLRCARSLLLHCRTPLQRPTLPATDIPGAGETSQRSTTNTRE